jgi:hypothetical protein
MKAEAQLRQAITDAMAIFEDGVSREYMGEKLGNLIGVLEVFTDKNFNHKEQETLFNIASERLHQVEQEVK